MKISRTVFLALTGAMGATTACYTPSPPPRPVAYPYAPPTYAQPRPAVTTYYYINSQGQRVAARVVLRRRRPAVGRATSDPTYRLAAPQVSEAGSSAEISAASLATMGPPSAATPPVTPAAGEGEGCLDTSSTPVPECSNLKLDPGCGIRSFVLQKCNTYRDYLDPTVATVAVDCMERMSSQQLCDAENTYNCGKQALSEACPDSDLAQLCVIAANTCKTSASDCTALLSGLNDTAKQDVARCISTGCHAGLYSCVEGLSSSNSGARR
jgi:hypothetical protein